MGRGRQKAKDAKIARELKYTNHGGDLRALERELLHGPAPVGAAAAVDTAVVEDDEDLYDRWATDDEDDDEADEQN